jgi:hypothetical protein
VAQGPSVRKVKKAKRDLEVSALPAGMNRRRFLTFLGTGSAALAAGSLGLLAGCAEGEEQGANGQGSRDGEEGGRGVDPATPASFRAIEPTDEDDLVLPEGFAAPGTLWAATGSSVTTTTTWRTSP